MNIDYKDCISVGMFYEMSKLVVYKLFVFNGKVKTVIYREGKEPEELS